MFRTLAAAALSAVTLAFLTVPASASAAQPTYIDDFASSVTTVVYQQPVTFTGELLEGKSLTPVANEPVQIQIQLPGEGQWTTVQTGTTATNGQFTVSTPLPSGGYVRAAFAGDTGLAPSHSTPGYGILLDAAHLASRLLINPIPTSVSAGTPVVFSGTLQVQVSGSWEPFQGGTPLTLTMEPYTSTQSNVTYPTTTGADGTFSLTEPVTETSDWIVDTSLNDDYWSDWIPDYASANYNWIDGVSRTEVVGFHLPRKEEAHAAFRKGLYATGTVERWNGSSWVGLAYGSVEFYYRPGGSKSWHKDSGVQANALGQFKSPVGIHLGTSSWQARVQPAADTLTSTSATTSTITDRTRFLSVHIQRTASGSQTYGTVTDLFGQISFSSLRGLKLRLYDRALGSRTWHLDKTVRVGRNGAFNIHAAKSYGYRFKVVFPAQGAYLSCSSRTV